MTNEISGGTYTSPSELLMTINNNVIRLNVQFENLNGKIDNHTSTLEKLDSRVRDLEAKEGIRAQNMWKQILGIISAIITTVVASFLISRIPPSLP